MNNLTTTISTAKQILTTLALFDILSFAFIIVLIVILIKNL